MKGNIFQSNSKSLLTYDNIFLAYLEVISTMMERYFLFKLTLIIVAIHSGKFLSGYIPRKERFIQTIS